MSMSSPATREPRLQTEPLEVISGTHRTVDLIPAFLDMLIELDRPTAGEIAREFNDRLTQIRNHTEPFDIESHDDDEYLFDALYEALNTQAGPGLYFGAHAGDGAAFGYWPVDDD